MGVKQELYKDNSKEGLAQKYNDIKSTSSLIKQQKEELEKIQNNIKELQEALVSKQLNYRINSVRRVLKHLRDYHTQLNGSDIDIMLCHCQNKLNGNIDGVEMALDFHNKPSTE